MIHGLVVGCTPTTTSCTTRLCTTVLMAPLVAMDSATNSSEWEAALMCAWMLSCCNAIW